MNYELQCKINFPFSTEYSDIYSTWQELILVDILEEVTKLKEAAENY